MIALTVPLLFAPITAFRFDAVWFGVILVLFLEVRILTPPFGINLFVIQSIWTGRIGQVIAGTAPFVLIMIIFVALLTALPELALYLPSQMQAR